MSSRLRDRLLILSGVAVLIAGAIVATRSRQPHSAALVASVSLSSSNAAPSASAPKPPPLPAGLNFVFDCAAFAPAIANPCPTARTTPVAETALLNLVNSYRVSAVPCSSWRASDIEGAEATLRAAQSLDPKELAPIDRALLQNAALELLSCQPAVGAGKKSSAVATTARKMIGQFTLSPSELSGLPDSAATINAWLGDGTSWKRGVDPRFFHTSSDGFARAHRQLQQGDTLADLVRLVLVNKSLVPFVSDVVQRVVLRRTRADGIHLCIAELDPASATCGPVALQPLTQERGAAVLTGPPPCVGCHAKNTPRSSSFGPDTGFALNDASATRIAAALKGVLAR